MNSRKIVIRTALVLIGLPIVLVLILFGFFYSVFYFPNWTSATTGTIISSGQKREYLLYVPKSYDRTKPTPLVISLHGAMTWPSSLMAVSQWNLVADENGFRSQVLGHDRKRHAIAYARCHFHLGVDRQAGGVLQHRQGTDLRKRVV